MKVKVKPGILLRDPRNMQPISETGTNVPDNTFWRRRLKAGDVELVKVNEVETQSQTKTTTKKKDKK